ncbi:hypothetical protein ACFQU3_24000 [Terrabacter sp. GCM10028922]
MNKTLRGVLALGAALVLTPAALAAVALPSAELDGRGDSVAAIRAATAPYHDVEAAIAAGYLPTDECVAAPAGAMGYHYVKPSLLGQPPDLRRPSVLLYLPTGDGLKLGGVEWVQADGDQDPTTDTDRPSLLGVPFAGPMPGHGPDQPVHYDLHAWVWQNNPAGMFEPFNPRASC